MSTCMQSFNFSVSAGQFGVLIVLSGGTCQQSFTFSVNVAQFDVVLSARVDNHSKGVKLATSQMYSLFIFLVDFFFLNIYLKYLQQKEERKTKNRKEKKKKKYIYI